MDRSKNERNDPVRATTNGSDSASAALESIRVARAATVQAIAALECTPIAGHKCSAYTKAAHWAKKARMALDIAQWSIQGRMGQQGMSSQKAALCGSFLQDGQIEMARSLGQLSVPCRTLEVPRGHSPLQGKSTWQGKPSNSSSSNASCKPM